MTDYIVTQERLPVGSRDYTFADRFDIDGHVSRKELEPRTIEILKRQGQIKPLDRDTFRNLLARRPAGAPMPLGFTEAYLLEKGIIDHAPAERAPPKPNVTSEIIDVVPLTNDSYLYAGYVITPRKAGPRMIYNVTDGDGKLLRAKGFGKEEAAKAFLDQFAKGAESTGGES